ATAPRLLVFQHAAKHAPALIKYSLVQPGLLRHLPAWFFRCASGRLRHMLHLQVLNHNHRVVFAGLCAELMQEVVAAIGNADIELRNTSLLLLPVAGVLHHASQIALHTGFLGGHTAVGLQRGMQLAIRDRRKGGNPQVDPNVRCRRMYRGFNLHLDLEGHKPVLSLSGDGDVLYRAFDRATLPELDPPDHGQIDLASIQLEALRITEAIGQKLLAIARWSSTTSEEIGIGAFQILQALLKNLRMHLFEPAVFLALLPPCHQLAGFGIGEARDTREVAVLVDRQNLVPDKATGP